MDNNLRNKMILWGWIDEAGRETPWYVHRKYVPARPVRPLGGRTKTNNITLTKKGEYYWAHFHAGMLVGGTSKDPTEAVYRAKQLITRRKITPYKPRLYYNI